MLIVRDSIDVLRQLSHRQYNKVCVKLNQTYNDWSLTAYHDDKKQIKGIGKRDGQVIPFTLKIS